MLRAAAVVAVALLPTTPRFLDYGQVWSIAGSASTFAVATASGRIVTFDSTSRTLLGIIADFSAKLLLALPH